MNSPKVGIVILNWNNYPDTRDCLNSLRALVYSNVELMVVDNASIDDSLQLLKNKFGDLIFVESVNNSGYAGGMNQGIEVAMARKCDYVALLNNDTIVRPDFLDPLVEFAESHQDTGILGCKICYHNEPRRIWSMGGHVRLFSAGGKYVGEGELDVGQYKQPLELSLISGCMMFIRSGLLADIGKLNDSYFFRGEEWEFCWRAKRAGYRMFCIPESVILHKENRSHNRFDAKYIYSAYMAKQMFVRQFMPMLLRPFWRASFIIYSRLFAVNKFRKIGRRKGFEVDGEVLTRAIRLALSDGAYKTRVTEADLNRCVEMTTT